MDSNSCLKIVGCSVCVAGICRNQTFLEMPRQLSKTQAFPEMPRQLRKFVIFLE